MQQSGQVGLSDARQLPVPPVGRGVRRHRSLNRGKGALKRIPGGSAGRCAAVQSGGLVYAVATDPACGQSIEEQTQGTLQALDDTLLKAGSGKSGLVQATVYLSDITLKARMDAVWCKWIGPEENWPQRACIGVALEDRYLIEIVVTAKVL